MIAVGRHCGVAVRRGGAALWRGGLCAVARAARLRRLRTKADCVRLLVYCHLSVNFLSAVRCLAVLDRPRRPAGPQRAHPPAPSRPVYWRCAVEETRDPEGWRVPGHPDGVEQRKDVLGLLLSTNAARSSAGISDDT